MSILILVLILAAFSGIGIAIGFIGRDIGVLSAEIEFLYKQQSLDSDYSQAQFMQIRSQLSQILTAQKAKKDE